ncbi:TPA: hypothetical protein QDC20_001515 [Burkholderia aenigmatica]|uniref:hypothetical protein n=1 Tax=Burkholderia sp. AU45251 TaxID=3059204 RepID=UPI00264EDA9A|nr:hypothetical protein [Burkholderia sp. AU45251]HDR9485859.1 hypothetical protein [Burkholderia aenigmatica]MDN7519241.1 hypothetical protein [Burkholderia sp. AU45251]HDR9517226.1 hypothetical protein [Burkholderia aenigmatica]HDR9594282.1 hypothetical protein [Burkholderia aenigmatica]HDR9601509.1 hypothetical protein [Burkholderia aenigmatica]
MKSRKSLYFMKMVRATRKAGSDGRAQRPAAAPNRPTILPAPPHACPTEKKVDRAQPLYGMGLAI